MGPGTTNAAISENRPGPLPKGPADAPIGGPVADWALQIEQVSRIFYSSKREFTALADVTLNACDGEFVALVGPSGCGKSTLLNVIAGLARPASGTVRVLGKEVKSIQRDVGFIFQKDALLPWRTARQNIELPVRFRGASRRDAREVAESWLGRVGLAKFGDRFPHQLSGGMRKRVSIAATMSCEPRILLMDEPFSALDVETRTLMESDLLGLWELNKPTVLFITHDLQEAVQLADRVVVMSAAPGRVIGSYEVQLARPRDLVQTRYDEHAVELQKEIWSLLSAEVQEAYQNSMKA